MHSISRAIYNTEKLIARSNVKKSNTAGRKFEESHQEANRCKTPKKKLTTLKSTEKPEAE